MRRKVTIIANILFAVLLMSGCDRTAAENTATPAPQTAAPTAAAKKPADVSDVVIDSDYIKNLLLKATKLEGYSYRAEVSGGEAYWVFGEGTKRRIQPENGDGEIILLDGMSEMTVYDEKTRTGYRTAAVKTPLDELFFDKTDLGATHFKYVSQEPVGNIPCMVLQIDAANGTQKRLWISEEHGIVISCTITDVLGTTEYKISELSVEKQSEATFKVAPDIQITER